MIIITFYNSLESHYLVTSLQIAHVTYLLLKLQRCEKDTFIVAKVFGFIAPVFLDLCNLIHLHLFTSFVVVWVS